MRLLDRYLSAVRGHLPEEQQDDIVRELSENIRAQMDDKAAELGHPLNEAEQETIIKRHGHPIFVAGRYLPQQQLIGPGLFPIYWVTLKTVLPIAYVIVIVLSCMTLIVGSAVAFSGEPVPGALQSPTSIIWFAVTILLAISG